MRTDKKRSIAIIGMIICGILILGFYWADHLSGASGLKDNLPHTGSVHPSAKIQLPYTAIITVNPIPEYPVGKTVTISGTTTLPVGEILDIAMLKEPYHTTKCAPGIFCGSGRYSTTVSAGREGNVWSLDLNTTGFTAGGYDFWVVARNNSNVSVPAGLNLYKKE